MPPDMTDLVAAATVVRNMFPILPTVPQPAPLMAAGAAASIRQFVIHQHLLRPNVVTPTAILIALRLIVPTPYVLLEPRQAFQAQAHGAGPAPAAARFKTVVLQCVSLTHTLGYKAALAPVRPHAAAALKPSRSIASVRTELALLTATVQLENRQPLSPVIPKPVLS